MGTAEQQEFYVANRGLIDTITSHTDRIIQAFPDAVVIEKDYGEDARFVSGASTAESVTADYEEYGLSIEPTAAEAGAEKVNELELYKAEGEIRVLRTIATWMFFGSSKTKEPHLDFTTASDRHAYMADELTHTQINGLEHYGQASGYAIQLFGELVKQELTVVLLGENVSSLRWKTEPIEDERLVAWFTVIGGNDDLQNILVGRYADEEELDLKLSGIWQQFIGTAHEEVISPMLEEIRLRAIAAKESLAMRAAMGMDLPDFETLEDIASYLATL